MKTHCLTSRSSIPSVAPTFSFSFLRQEMQNSEAQIFSRRDYMRVNCQSLALSKPIRGRKRSSIGLSQFLFEYLIDIR